MMVLFLFTSFYTRWLLSCGFKKKHFFFFWSIKDFVKCRIRRSQLYSWHSCWCELVMSFLLSGVRQWACVHKNTNAGLRGGTKATEWACEFLGGKGRARQQSSDMSGPIGVKLCLWRVIKKPWKLLCSQILLQCTKVLRSLQLFFTLPVETTSA